MSEIGISTQVFSLLGNWLCLDFTNTIDDRLSEPPQELLLTYSDLVAWGEQAGIITNQEALHLLAEAHRYPDLAETTRLQAITLRETLYRIFAATADDGEGPVEADLNLFNTALSEAMSMTRILMKEDHFVWGWSVQEHALKRILWEVARSAATLLTSVEVHSVRQCASDTCTWLFLDTSKNHSRRWCDMKNCGNRAKVSRHYGRKKAARQS